MIRRPPRSTLSSSSAASDVYKRQHMDTRAVRDAAGGGEEWVINGVKRWISAAHMATHDIVFARTSGEPGDHRGITAFIVATDSPGFTVEFFWWTLNMPADAAELTLR